MFEKTKEFCDQFLENHVPGFDVMVCHKGKCILRYFNGYSSLEEKIPMNGKERYNIYSCSKVITCTAALQLWEKGLFSLEDPLSKYMPEFAHMKVQTEEGLKDAENPILIKHLFEMTAGFSYKISENLKKGVAETDGRGPTREMMKYLAKDPLLFEPGDRWEYSFCHDVLAAFVEVITGEKFEDYVKKNIFDPLGMDRSTFMLPEEELEEIAEQYRFEEGKLKNVGKPICWYKLGSEFASGGAGGISTVEDYMKFLEGLRTGKLLKLETVKLMATDRLTEHQKRTFWTKETHGYGLGVRCPKGDPRFVDFGWGGAAGAYLAIDMEDEISLYIGLHLLSAPVQGFRSLIHRMVRAELFGSEDFESICAEIKKLCDYNLTY